MPSTLINAAIVGAQRSGTTWLARSLDFHPEIALARNKEAHIFDEPTVQRRGVSQAQIRELFAESRTGQILLDATPSYIYLPGCLDALKRHNPSAKVVVILRDPGQRAVSHYYHSRSRGAEDRGILGALSAERIRLRVGCRSALDPASPARDHSYLDRGRYFAQVDNLLSLFPESLVIPFPLIKSQPHLVLDSVQTYLGVEVLPLPTVADRNSGIRPRHRVLGKAISFGLRRDTREAFRTLNWSPRALDENLRS